MANNYLGIMLDKISGDFGVYDPVLMKSNEFNGKQFYLHIADIAFKAASAARPQLSQKLLQYAQEKQKYASTIISASKKTYKFTNDLQIKGIFIEDEKSFKAIYKAIFTNNEYVFGDHTLNKDTLNFESTSDALDKDFNAELVKMVLVELCGGFD